MFALTPIPALLNKTSSLQKVYENASILKEALESIVQTKVKITFDNDEKNNPENKKLKKYSHLVNELEYTTVAIQNIKTKDIFRDIDRSCLLYTSPSPRDRTRCRMPSSA